MTSHTAITELELLEHSYTVNTITNNDGGVHEECFTYATPDPSVSITKDVAVGCIVENSRITADDWDQDVRLIEIQLQPDNSSSSNSNEYIGSSYRAGDVAYIYPHNSSSDAMRMIRILSRSLSNEDNVNKDTWVQIQNISTCKRTKQLGNTKCTIFNLFRKCLDINGIPQRSFFEICSLYAEDEEEKEKLLEIASGEGTDIYLDFCVLAKRSYIEILEDFVSVKLNLDVLLELLPRVLPRQYSIASSGLESPDRLHLCVGLVSYKTRYGREKKGQ